jgi:hypothetical protein
MDTKGHMKTLDTKGHSPVSSDLEDDRDMTLYKRCDCRPTTTCPHPWWYKFKFARAVYRASTRTTNRALATRISRKVRDQIVAQAFGVSA